MKRNRNDADSFRQTFSLTFFFKISKFTRQTSEVYIALHLCSVLLPVIVLCNLPTTELTVFVTCLKRNEVLSVDVFEPTRTEQRDPMMGL